MSYRENQFTFSELCTAIGKSSFFVSNVQRTLGLYIPPSGQKYSAAYVAFMEKVVALRTFNIPLTDIAELFNKEKRLLELLKCDALSDSPTWYLDGCGAPKRSNRHLLLTGYDLKFDMTSHSIQPNLDFGIRDGELFTGHEMGEDLSLAIKLYRKLEKKIRTRVEKETPVLKNALYWGARAF